MELDDLDFALLDSLHAEPKIGVLELSRRIKIARATVQARVSRLEQSGLIAGYEPHIDIASAGFGVHAFVMLETSQADLDVVTAELEAIPGVLEAFATTGTADLLCRVAASSHQALQRTLIELNKSTMVARSTSLMVLSVVVPYRSLPLLQTLERSRQSKAPAFRVNGR